VNQLISLAIFRNGSQKYKPTTPGQRFKIISAFDDITTNKPEKAF